MEQEKCVPSADIQKHLRDARQYSAESVVAGYLDLVIDDGDDVVLRTLHGRRCQRIRTDGDGKCAIHSAFGKVSVNGELFHPSASALIKESLTMSVAEMERRLRPEQQHLIAKVTTGIWRDIVVPNWTNPAMWHTLATEPRNFLRHFSAQVDEPTKISINDSLAVWNASTSQRDQARALCKQQSAKVFRQDLEPKIWRKLAVQQGLLPNAEVNYLTASAACIAAFTELDSDSFQAMRTSFKDPGKSLATES